MDLSVDSEICKIIFTSTATFITTVLSLGKWFNGSLNALNLRINQLSESINTLDKNLAVQTALFERCMEKRDE